MARFTNIVEFAQSKSPHFSANNSLQRRYNAFRLLLTPATFTKVFRERKAGERTAGETDMVGHLRMPIYGNDSCLFAEHSGFALTLFG